MRFELLILMSFFMLCAFTTQSTLKCEGVTWNKKRNLWQAEFHINGKKRTSYFRNDFDAKKLYKICATLEIPSQNPECSVIPNQQKNEKTSQYRGVYWHREKGKWYVLIYVKGKKQKYGGMFKDELDAANGVNQLCEKLGIPLQNPEISAITNEQYQKKEKTSQYKGVSWHKYLGKWVALIYLKGHIPRYGGHFNDELDAAKRANQLCEEFGIPTQNPAICGIPNQQYQKQEKTSQYKGVFWHRERKKWYVQIYYSKEKKQKSGGSFNDELDAAKRVNQLCEQFGIPPHNPEINAMANEQYQKKEKTSIYKGVSWNRKGKKWCVHLSLKGGETKYGGQFKDELDAGKRVNQLCEELGIPLKNPTISAIPNEKYQKQEKTSQYKGVTWHKQKKRWYARLSVKGEEPKYGGIFKNELDAANRVNQLCEELGIPLQNPGIMETPNQQSPYNGYRIDANTVINSEILKTDSDDAETKKRKRAKEKFNDNDKLPYFYKHFLN